MILSRAAILWIYQHNSIDIVMLIIGSDVQLDCYTSVNLNLDSVNL